MTLIADFAVPEKITSTLTWLRPTSISWDKINQETWHHNLGRLPAPDHQLLYILSYLQNGRNTGKLHWMDVCKINLMVIYHTLLEDVRNALNQ